MMDAPYSYSRDYAIRTIKRARAEVLQSIQETVRSIAGSFVPLGASRSGTGLTSNCCIFGDAHIGSGSLLLDSRVLPDAKLTIGKNSLVVGCDFSNDTVIGDNCFLYKTLIAATRTEVGDDVVSLVGIFSGSSSIKLGAGALVCLGGIQSTHKHAGKYVSIGKGAVFFDKALTINTEAAVIGRDLTLAPMPQKTEDIESAGSVTGAKLREADQFAYHRIVLTSRSITIGNGVRLLGNPTLITPKYLRISDGARISTGEDGLEGGINYASLQVGAGAVLHIGRRFMSRMHRKLHLQLCTGAFMLDNTGNSAFTAETGDRIVLPAFSRFEM